MSVNIRKIVTVVDETLTEMGRPVSPPVRRAAAIAVIENPFAGRYVEDLAPLIAAGEELGKLLSNARSPRSGLRAQRLRATARRRSSARTGKWSMRPRSCIPRWERRSGRRSAKAQR